MDKISAFVTCLLLLLASALVLTFPLNSSNKRTGSRIESETEEQSERSSPARAEFFYHMLRDPATGQIPGNSRTRELAYSRFLDQQTGYRSIASASGFNWSAAGPYDAGGRTRALAIDVTNPDVIIAGGVSGGIWKSTDQGKTWALKTGPDQVLSVTWIAQDPRIGHTNTWYYCTGEFNGNSASGISFSSFYGGSGIYRSTDNGENWQVLPGTAVADPVSWSSVYEYGSKIIVSPATGSVFYASNAGIIMKSVDQGDHFTTVLGGIYDHTYTDIDVAADGELIACLSELHPSGYVATTAPGIYLSDDDGDTWHNITPSDFPAKFERSVVAFAPSDTSVAYSLTYTGGTVNNHDEMVFYKYSIGDTSATSENRSANLPEFSSEIGNFAQSDYDLVMAVKPDDPDFVLLGSTNLYRSFDGFTTKANSPDTNWVGGYGIYSTPDNITLYPGHHEDQHIILFRKDQPSVCYTGSDGGISVTSDITATGSGEVVHWNKLNRGYLVTQFYDVTMRSEKGDDRVLGGTQDTGTPFFHISTDLNTPSEDVGTGDGGYAFFGIDYAYVSNYNGTIRRKPYDTNGNVTYALFAGRVQPYDAKNQLFINPYALDPNADNVMYYPSGDILWRDTLMNSTDLSLLLDNWSAVSGVSAPVGENFTAIRVSENPSHIVYLGTSGDDKSMPHVYRMGNSVTADTAVDVSDPNFPLGGYISDIAVNPIQADEIMVVFSNYNVSSLFYSDDGGKSYSEVEGNLQGPLYNTGEYLGPSVRAAAIVTTGDGKYFLAGTSTGLYMTTILNGSQTQWVKQAGNLMGEAVVSRLYARSADGWVAVATHGRGVFLGKPNTVVPIAENPVADQPTSFSLSQNYPNPFNPSTNIPFKLAESARVTLQVYDLTGRLVATLIDDAYRSAGRYETRFDARQLASGTYFYRLTAITKGNHLTRTRKMLLIR